MSDPDGFVPRERPVYGGRGLVVVFAVGVGIIVLAGAARMMGQSALSPVLVNTHLKLKEYPGPYAFYSVRTVLHETIPPRLIIECDLLEKSSFNREFPDLPENEQDQWMAREATELHRVLMHELNDDDYWSERTVVRFLRPMDGQPTTLIAEWQDSSLVRVARRQ